MGISRAPRRKMYRTMQGRMVDIEKLRGANENTPAVGNMKVNARGDVLGKSGQIIKAKEKVMKEYYETPKGRATEHPRIKTASKQKVIQPKAVIEKTVAPKVTKAVETTKPKTTATKSGIDAALDGIE
jgi:hypothetical protein